MSQTTSPNDVAVICTADTAVPAETLGTLCLGLQQALIAQHPDARFALATDLPAKGAAFVAMEALVATKATIEARLTWQAAGRLPVTGPRAGFSISDKDLTPALQQKFLNRLVQDTTLPF